MEIPATPVQHDRRLWATMPIAGQQRYVGSLTPPMGTNSVGRRNFSAVCRDHFDTAFQKSTVAETRSVRGSPTAKVLKVETPAQ